MNSIIVTTFDLMHQDESCCLQKAEAENYRRGHVEKCCATTSSLNNSKGKLPIDSSLASDRLTKGKESIGANGTRDRERHTGKTKSISFCDTTQVISVDNEGYDQIYYDDVKAHAAKHDGQVSERNTQPVVKTDITSWDEMTQVYRSALSHANPHLDSALATHDGTTVLVASNNQLSPLTNGLPTGEITDFQSSGSTTNIHVYCSGDVNVNSGVAGRPAHGSDLAIHAVGATTRVYCTDNVAADLHPSGICCIEDADRNARNTSRTTAMSPKYALCNGVQRGDVRGGFREKRGIVTSPTASLQNGRYSDQVCEALDELDAVVTSFTAGKL